MSPYLCDLEAAGHGTAPAQAPNAQNGSPSTTGALTPAHLGGSAPESSLHPPLHPTAAWEPQGPTPPYRGENGSELCDFPTPGRPRNRPRGCQSGWALLPASGPPGSGRGWGPWALEMEGQAGHPQAVGSGWILGLLLLPATPSIPGTSSQPTGARVSPSPPHPVQPPAGPAGRHRPLFMSLFL